VIPEPQQPPDWQPPDRQPPDWQATAGRRPAPAGQGPAGQQPGGQQPGGGKPKRKRRTLLAILIIAVLVLGGAAGGLAYVGPQRVRDLLSPSQAAPTAPMRVPSASPVLGALDGSAPMPDASAVAAALKGPAGAPELGPSVNISVLDVASGTRLYDSGASHEAVPASTTKLATAAAVLSTRGAGYRITTTAVAGAAPGEVVLVGAGDPTLTAAAGGYYPGAGRLDQLAAQVKAALGGQAPTAVRYDGSLYVGLRAGPGWDSDASKGPFGAPVTALALDGARVSSKRPENIDDIHDGQARVSQPDVTAARAFAKALGLPRTAVSAGRAPSGARQLGAVQSPRIDSLVEVMLAESDNVVAEALARQVAIATGKPASFTGAGEAIKQTLAGLGVPVGDAILVDGSGLSRQDRQSPAMQTGLLALAAGGEHPELHALFGGLPVGGWSGTLADRNTTARGAPEPGAGVVRAKTGTLTGVAAIAGIIVTRHGRLLAFSVLVDAVPAGTDTDTARAKLDVVTNALAFL
jgi:D-alanyl-D-alanine carboxypeptidase/D-alanyl-D-alanine-endopeptidase (penicillin-binding protein 4)